MVAIKAKLFPVLHAYHILEYANIDATNILKRLPGAERSVPFRLQAHPPGEN